MEIIKIEFKVTSLSSESFTVPLSPRTLGSQSVVQVALGLGTWMMSSVLGSTRDLWLETSINKLSLVPMTMSQLRKEIL